MISVNEASQLVLHTSMKVSTKQLPLSECVGKILKEDIINDRDQPPFDKSLMDGIVINVSAWSEGVRSFIVEGVLPAGQIAKPLKRSNGCYRIMTGAVIPKGANAVIPVERVTVQDDHALVEGILTVSANQFIRYAGSDAKKGDILVSQGCQLTSAHIGVAASVGMKTLKVSAPIKIAIVSTGDELVPLGQPVKQFQTRVSNAYALKALVETDGLAIGTIFQLKDDEKSMKLGLKKILADFDMVILSGGVSKGDFDLVPKVLKELKVKEVFHQVAQKPGKPLWFGRTMKGKSVFGLPGNPVSTYICAFRYVMPLLYQASGYTQKVTHVKVGAPVTPNKELTQFIPVNVINRNGELYAYPINHGGSGDFASLVKADGFIEYDSNTKESIRPYISWRA